VLTRSDLARLVAWLGIGRQQAQPVERGTSRVGSLLDVKERASRELDAAPRAVPPPAEPAAPSAPRQPKPQEPAPRRETPRRQPEGSTVSSLLASKRRRSEGDER